MSFFPYFLCSFFFKYETISLVSGHNYGSKIGINNSSLHSKASHTPFNSVRDFPLISVKARSSPLSFKIIAVKYPLDNKGDC